MAGLEAGRARVHRYLEQELWRRDDGVAPAARLARRALQLAVIVVQGAARNQMLLRASALTYFAMLSLIPLLALALSMVEAFGVSGDLARLAVDRVAAGSPEARDRILELVERANFRGLGALGGAALFVTTVLALSSVERAFNRIWGIERERPLTRRFADYLAVLVVAPILLGAALSVAASLRSQTLVQALLQQTEFGGLDRLALGAVPVAFQWLGFAFLYGFVPNTKVRLGSALAGGALAAVLLVVAQHVYLGFNIGAARSDALFGSFAALPLLLVWIYASWAIVLLGCELAFAVQNLGSFRQAREGEEPGPAAREAIGLAVAARVARAFRTGAGCVAAEALAEELDVPVRTVRGVLLELEASGVVAPRGDAEPDAWQLGRAAEAIAVGEVLAAMRGSRRFGGRELEGDAPVRALLAQLDRAGAEALHGRTLADLAAPSAPRGPVDPGGGGA